MIESRLALAAAGRRGPLGRDQQVKLSREGVAVRRAWAMRADIEPGLLESAFLKETDWVVKARLLSCPTVPWTRALGLLGSVGAAGAMVALRDDCPDAVAAGLLGNLSNRGLGSLPYALRMGRDRGSVLTNRELTVDSLLRRSRYWADFLDVSHLVGEGRVRAMFLDELDARIARDGSVFYSETDQQDAIDFMYHDGPGWLSAYLEGRHAEGCFGCALLDREPEEKPIHTWLLPGILAMDLGVMEDVWSMYGRESGEVLAMLLARSTQPFWRIVDAAGRLTGDPLVAELLDESGVRTAGWGEAQKNPGGGPGFFAGI